MGEPRVEENVNVDVMKSAYNYRSNQNILHYDLKSHLRLLEHIRKNPNNKHNKYIRPLNSSPKHHRLIEPITPVCSFDSFHSKRSGEYYRFSIDRPQSSKMNLYDRSTVIHDDDYDYNIDDDNDDNKNDNKNNVNNKNDNNMNTVKGGYKGITSEKELKDLHQQYFKFINHRDIKKMKQSNMNSHLFKKVWIKPEITKLDYKPYHKCKTKINDHPELIVKDSSTITAIGSTILALEGTSNHMNFVMDRNARNNNNNNNNTINNMNNNINNTSSWTASSDISQHLLPLSDMHIEQTRCPTTTETQHHQLWTSTLQLSSSSSLSCPTSAILHSSRRNSGVAPLQHQPLSSHTLSSSSSTTSSSTAVAQSMRHISPIKSEASKSSTVPRPRSAVPQSSSSSPTQPLSSPSPTQPLSSSSLKSSNIHKSRPRSAVPFTTSPIAESSESSSSSFHSSSVVVDLHLHSSRPHSAAPSSTSPKPVETCKSISRPQLSPTHIHLTAYRSSTGALVSSSHAQSTSQTTTIQQACIRPQSAAPQSSPIISPYLIIPPRPKSAAPNMQQISRSQSRPTTSTRRRKPKLNNFHTRY